MQHTVEEIKNDLIRNLLQERTTLQPHHPLSLPRTNLCQQSTVMSTMCQGLTPQTPYSQLGEIP
jgi:hypothetical protein